MPEVQDDWPGLYQYSDGDSDMRCDLEKEVEETKMSENKLK